MTFWAGQRPDWVDELSIAGYFLGISLLVWFPLLGDGYVLTLDMVFSPGMDHVMYGLQSTDPLYYGRLPVLAIMDVLSFVLGNQFVQKLLLVGILVVSGYSMARACRDYSIYARLYAGTLYAINPFVYVRFLAGHWQFLLGYAVLPIAIIVSYEYLTSRESQGQNLLARGGVLLAFTAAIDPHIAVLLSIVLIIIIGGLIRDRSLSTVFSRVIRLGVVSIGLSAFWLVPAIHFVVTAGSKLSVISSADLVTFTAAGTVARNVPLSLAMLYGFWRDGYLLTFSVLPDSLVWGLFFLILLFATYGYYHERDNPLVTAVALSACFGFILSNGISYPLFRPIFEFLFDTIVVLRGMRDTQKFVALLAVGYAFLGGICVHKVGTMVSRWSRSARSNLSSNYLTPHRIGTVVAIILLLCIPLAYTAPMLFGFNGQLHSTDYPEEWYDANQRLNEDDSEYRVLFLPWHQYLAFPWTDRTVVNPADAFFEQPVIRGRNVEILGVESHGNYPAHQAVTRILADHTNRDDFGARIRPAGVKYVIVAKAVDYQDYTYLRDQADLTAILENNKLVIYHNQAFSAEPSSEWLRSTPSVSWLALKIGGVISALTGLWLMVRSGTVTSIPDLTSWLGQLFHR